MGGCRGGGEGVAAAAVGGIGLRSYSYNIHALGDEELGT
jgi:hypothetical protein